MTRHKIGIFIVLCLGILFAQTLRIGNRYVEVVVDRCTGDFDQGADPSGAGAYTDITFSYPSPPGTEWVMFYIDGTVRKNQGWIISNVTCLIYPPPSCFFPTVTDYNATMPCSDVNYIRTSDSTIVIQWNNYMGVMIREELTPKSLGPMPGSLEQVRCRITMKPVDGACHSLGAAVYYDTQLRGHDGAPISTAYGYRGHSEIFYAPDIPPIWRAYEIAYPPSPGDLIALGILIGFEATMPDVFWYGPWREAWNVWEITYELGWNTSPTAPWYMWYHVAAAALNFSHDSAVLVKWNQRTVCPGDSVVFVTYYGIEGAMSTRVYFTHDPPDLRASCTNISPNPMTLTFMITNGGSTTANNVCLDLTLPPGMSIVGGAADPACFPTIAGYGGSQIVQWNVQINPSLYGTTQCYSARLSYSGGTDSTATFCINIPAPSAPSITMPSNQTICAGSCISLAPTVTGGTPPYTYNWSPAAGLSCTNCLSPNACPMTTTTYRFIVSDAVGCADTEFVTITVGSPVVVMPPHQTICEGTCVTLAPTVSGGTPPYTYSWSPAAGLSCTDCLSPVACPSATATYTFIVRDAIGCADTEFVSVNVIPTLDVNFVYPEPCFGISSCANQWAAVAIGEISTLTSSDTLILWTNGVQTRTPAILFPWHFSPDTGLIIEIRPPVPWVHGDSVFIIAQFSHGGCRGNMDTCGFLIDLMPPDTSNAIPAPGDTVMIPSPEISIELSDSFSGVNPDSIRVSVWVNGVLATGYVTSFADPVLNIDGLSFRSGDSVRVCITRVVDSPDYSYCPPNDSSYCWSFFVIMGNVLAAPVVPLPNLVTACEDQEIVIYLAGTDAPIDTSSIELWMTYNHGASEIYVEWGDSRLSYNFVEDELTFDPGAPIWLDADTICVALYAEDIYENGLDTLEYCFATDFSAPVVWNFFPPRGATITETRPSIRFGLCDSITGVENSSLWLSIDTNGVIIDTLWWRLGEILWSGCGIGSVDLSSFGIEFSDSDSVTICIGAHDQPDYCAPNELDTCWWFSVSLGHPTPRWVQYSPGSFVACNPGEQEIIATLSDPDGVNISTLRFWVITPGDTQVLVWSSAFIFDGETLTYTPSPWFADNETVGICIAYIEDMLGNAMTEPYCWQFVMDLTPPDLVYFAPPDGSVFPDHWDGEFYAEFVDTLSGVDVNSFFVRLCDRIFHYPSPGISIVPSVGVRFFIDPEILFGTDEWQQCTLICVSVADDPDYCAPNESTYCWNYRVTAGPNAQILTPLPAQITACDDQCIRILLWDEDLPVDTMSIRLVVEGDTFRIGSPELSYVADTLRFCPSVMWTNEQVVDVVLISADDSVGAHLQDTLRWNFSVDLEAPVMSSESPSSGDTIGYGTPPICFTLTDNLSGVNWDSLIIEIDESVAIRIDNPAVSRTGAMVCVDPIMLGLAWMGGDSAHVCVHAVDLPDICPPNVLDTCWTFFVEPGGPWGIIDHPFNGAWVSCVDTAVVMRILDEDTVNDTTIVISIWRSSSPSETLFVSYPDPTLTWFPSSGRLLYHPLMPFAEPETILVCIVYSEDLIGNPMEPRPVCSPFYMDQSQPIIWGLSPSPGDVMYSRSFPISFMISDSLSGLDISTMTIYVNGTAYGYTHPCVRIDWALCIPPCALVTIDSSCVSFAGCDTVNVRVIAADSIDYCADNVLDTSWTFSLDCEGPHAEEIYVPRDAWSSCVGDSIVIHLWDTAPGVDVSTISLSITGYGTISYPSPDLTYNPVTRMLVYRPSPPLPNWGHITVTLISARDLLGNTLETPLSWTFHLDRIRPLALNWLPGCGDTIANAHPDISMMPYDSGCGLVLDSTILTINDTLVYRYSDGDFDYVGGRFLFDPDDFGLRFRGGDLVEVCWHLVDCADDICLPNRLDTCCVFFITSGGPWSDITYRCEDEWVGCEAETLHFSFEDDDGIIDTTILFEVCSGVTCESCETLDISSPGVINIVSTPLSIDFDYILPSPDEDGISVCVHVLYAADALGNTIFDYGRGDTLEFLLDFTPPAIGTITPVPNDTVADGAPSICLQLSDAHSGVDASSIVMTIEGMNYSVGSPGFIWDGTNACFHPADIGIWWTGGTVVDVCIYARDRNCACPNSIDSCWNFVISPGGPVANILHPDSGIVSACLPESVIIRLFDPQGDNIVDNSIEVSVIRHGVSTVHVVGASPELDWDETSGILIYDPHPALGDGETVFVCVVFAQDTLGNDLVDTVCIEFSTDYSVYEAFGFTPPNLSVVETRTPQISLVMVDRITGIADSSIVLTVDGVPYTLSSPALWWDDETTLVFVPESAGIFWSGGDCIAVSIFAYDQPTPGYCNPNDTTYAWSFCIEPGGPVGTIIRPLNNTYSACEDEHIVMLLRDADGVDTSTIVLEVNGIQYTIADERLSYSNDTLYFYPQPPFADAATIYVSLVSASDMLGNPLDHVVSWHFTMDLTSPWSNLHEPSQFVVRDRTQDVVIVVGDQTSGVDSLSVMIWINDIQYGFSQFIWSPDISIQGGVVRFIPEAHGIIFPPGESVFVRIYATDSVHYCNHNVHDTTYLFFVEPEFSCLVHPNPFTPNGDNVNDMAVFDYPHMFTESAKLQIYDMRNVLVYERRIENVTDIRDFSIRNWKGNDNNGKPLPEGLYIWLILNEEGEVVCNGTVVLAR